jgi:isoleucyl-tRNA synthetase
VASARQSRKMKLRQPVSKVLVVTEAASVKRVTTSLRTLLLQQTNAKEVQLVGLREEEQLKRLLVEPNYKGLGPSFRQEANLVAEALRKADGRNVYEALAKTGTYTLTLSGKEFPITKDMVSFKEEMPENYASGSFDIGRVYVDITIADELAREGFVREMVRRLQEMRKRLDLPVDAFVDAYVTIHDPAKLEWLEDQREYLMGEVRVRTLHLLRPGETGPRAEMEGEWKIDDENFRLGIART